MTTSNINWSQYFMLLAQLTALRSKDPHTKVGAIIVDYDNRVVSMGYNGFVETPGCQNDEVFPWDNEGTFLDIKYAYVVHAELNAILNAKRDLSKCIMYCTLGPCNECAKAIVQSGIREVIYREDLYKDTPGRKAAELILSQARVQSTSWKELNIKSPIIQLLDPETGQSL